MGHLASRYRDASRSGVYRVTDAAIPRQAAAEAGATLTHLALADVAGDIAILDALRVAAGRDPDVVIVEGADGLAARCGSDFQALLAALEAVAGERRARGTPFYAVLADPQRVLALPTLYKEPAADP
jgi:hypothetical protein